MFEITLLINLFISLIKLKNIHEKYQIKEYTCKFEIDKIIYSKCSLEQHDVGKSSHKKRKDSPETRAVLLMFLLELEISAVAVQSIYQNSEKWRLLRTA